VRKRIGGIGILGLMVVAMPGLVSAGPPSDAGGGGETPRVTVDLDGRPIDAGRAAEFYCHDFDYPAIHCYRDSADLEASTAVTLAAAAVDYVVVFDYTWFAGPYMYISQDYTALVFLGWNDRISSFMARNSQRGYLWTDWFYSGTGYYFCCNQQVASLGSFNNTFSSVHRS